MNLPHQRPAVDRPAANRAYRREAGFTLLEIMMAIGIVAVLASLALPAYTSYMKRARMIEVTTFLGEARTALAAEYAAGNGFPDQLMGSQSRIAARQSGQAQVRARDSRIRMNSELINRYYYEYDKAREIAYFAVELNRDAVPECNGRCTIHLGATAVNDQLQFVCGRWSVANWRDPFPPNSLARECVSPNVNRELRRLARGR